MAEILPCTPPSNPLLSSPTEGLLSVPFAQAVISIGVIVIVALAAALAFVVLRRSNGHQRGFIASVTRVRAGETTHRPQL